MNAGQSEVKRKEKTNKINDNVNHRNSPIDVSVQNFCCLFKES